MRRLRVALGPYSALVRRQGKGYALALPPDDVDIGRFETLVKRPELRRRPSAPTGLGPCYGRRRGYGEANRSPASRTSPSTRLRKHASTAAHLALIVELADADLAAGDHAKVASELEAMVAKYPFTKSGSGLN